MMSKALSTIGLLTVLAALASCNYRVEKAPGQDAPAALLGARLSFKQVSSLIIGPRCLNCHSAAGGNQGNLNLETYAAVRAKLGVIQARTVGDKSMPPRNPLSAGELEALGRWISKGGPEVDNGSDEAQQPMTGWKVVQTKVFAKYCLQCHSSPAPEGALDLTSLTETRAKAGKIFSRVVIEQDMPLQDLPRPNEEERKLLADWLLAGMPQ